MKYYIKKEDLTIHDSCQEYIQVDEGLKEVVQKLLELGYKVSLSTEGKYKPEFELLYEMPINLIDYYEDNPHAKIIERRENNFDCWYENFASYISITFKGKYEFKNIPKGFNMNYYEFSNDQEIWTTVNFYEDDGQGKMKDLNLVADEIHEKHKLLLSWVENLPSAKEIVS